MSVERRERVEVDDLGDVERRRRVVEVAPTPGTVWRSRIKNFIGLLATVLVLLIVIRFVLMFIGANAASPFASFIYGITNPFVAPFTGLIQSPNITGAMVIDVPSVVAIVVYLLLTWLILEVINVLFGSRRTVRRVSRYDRVE